MNTMQASNPYDLSNELIIQPYHGGVRLTKPSENTDYENSIGNFNKLSASVYFLDAESTILSMNDAGVCLNGLLNTTDMYRKNVTHYLKKDYSSQILIRDQAVIQSRQIRINEESGTRKDEYAIHCVAVRMPWYYEDRLIGIFGICPSVDTSSLGNLVVSIQKLLTSGLIGSNVFSTSGHLTLSSNKSYYSKRELEVIDQLITGKSTKEIARLLNISNRTVEHHIENIKHKANCHTRHELTYKLTNKLL